MGIDVKALIEKQKHALDSVEPVDQEVLLGGQIVTVRIWPVSGGVWDELTSSNPARTVEDAEGNRVPVKYDLDLGYNLSGVVRSYPRLYLVDGDEVTPIVGEQWAEVYDVLSGPDKKALGYAVWGKNEFEPTQMKLAAGKASAGQRKKKRS